MRDWVSSTLLRGLLLVAAMAATSCGPTTSGTVPTLTPLVVPSEAPSAAPSASPDAGSGAITGEASDPDDEPAGSETPAISFTPGPTGPPAPTSAAGRLPGEPDPVLTPGSLNTAVTQDTIAATICKSGWTATIRPPTSYTNKLKGTQIAQYGYADTSLASYEEDHLISLELGGNPTDPRNLWPEPYTIALPEGRSTGAHVKDAFETKLKKQVCTGALTLAEAQAEVGIHWVHFYYHIP